jgi:pimeloyl-ACP methyl ester carboxylesterase
VRRTRAIVLVDLRGTGQSAPLSCFATGDELASLEAGRDAFLGAGPACLDELQRDPRHYTHRFALADLDDVRQWLGYEQINLWGGSWGTRAALLYALTYPNAVRRVVLDGAVALDMEFPHAVARDAQRAFDRLVTRCAADPPCAAASPDPHRDLSRLLAQLEQAPATVHLAHPRTHVRQPLTLTRDVVAEIVRVALYTTVDASRVLAMVRRAADGDFAPLVAQFVQSTSQSTDSMALGATLAILCSEDMPRVTQADFAEAAQGTFLRTAYADAWAARCDRWPVGHPLPSDLPQTSEVPALVLSGTEDPITPPSAGEAMRRWFPDSEHIIVNGAAHNTSFSGCLPDVIARFLDAAPLDAACVNDLPLPPAVTSLAGGRP